MRSNAGQCIGGGRDEREDLQVAQDLAKWDSCAELFEPILAGLGQIAELYGIRPECLGAVRK